MTNRRFDLPDQDLTPIPIPPRQRWREFRVVYLPPVTFLALIGIICWMWSNYVQPGAIIGEVEMVHANIISTVNGTVLNLKVDYLQAVTNGEVLGHRAEDVEQAQLRLPEAQEGLNRPCSVSVQGEELRSPRGRNRLRRS